MVSPIDDFIAAAKARQLCELTDTNGRTRLVEPYMVYINSQGKTHLHCFQLSGYSRSGRPKGWKNPAAASIRSVRKCDQTFLTRSEYNLDNRQLFPRISFNIPAIPGVRFPRSVASRKRAASKYWS